MADKDKRTWGQKLGEFFFQKAQEAIGTEGFQTAKDNTPYAPPKGSVGEWGANYGKGNVAWRREAMGQQPVADAAPGQKQRPWDANAAEGDQRSQPPVAPDGSDNVSRKPDSMKTTAGVVADATPSAAQRGDTSGGVSKWLEISKAGGDAEQKFMNLLERSGKAPIHEIRGTPIPRQTYDGPWRQGPNGMSFQMPSGKVMSGLDRANYYANNPMTQRFIDPRTMKSYNTALEAGTGVNATQAMMEDAGLKDMAMQELKNKGSLDVAQKQVEAAQAKAGVGDLTDLLGGPHMEATGGADSEMVERAFNEYNNPDIREGETEKQAQFRILSKYAPEVLVALDRRLSKK